MKKTKIIASLGPSTSDYQVIFNMIDLGVDVFQINLNYLSFKECDDLLKKIREASLKLDKIIGIMLDIPGPSIRLDKLKEEKVFLPLNKEIRLYNYHVVCNNTQLSTDYQNLVELVKLDDVIVLGAGNVKLKVIDLGYTCVGPHRDDLIFKINGMDCKYYSSQGQQRTVALVVKLSLMEVIKNEIGEYPILLLDDVLSELDQNRQDRLIELISKYQTLITCTKIPETKIKYNIIKVENGSII